MVHIGEVETEINDVSSAAFSCIGEIMGTFGSQVSGMNEYETKLVVMFAPKAHVLHGRDRHCHAENRQVF